MKYVIQKNDGTIGIMSMTRELDVMGQIAKSVDRDSIVGAHKIAQEDIPIDKSFRSAWVWNGKIEHDLTKAKEIALQRVRSERDPILSKLDGVTFKAIETEDSVLLAKVKADKQALRDITNTLKNLDAKSIDDIKATIPDLSPYKV